MYRVFEHEVDEVWGRLDEFIEKLQVLQFASLLLIEDVEVVFRSIQLHIFDLRRQIGLLFSYFLISFFELLFLFLKRSDLLVDLLFHHLVQVLLLYL